MVGLAVGIGGWFFLFLFLFDIFFPLNFSFLL